MTDPTEGVRRLLLEYDAPHNHLVEATQAGEAVWDTAEATALFRFHGFMAPFVSVTRLSDGARGTLEFTHGPRRYFNFVPARAE